jgi:hypothetical protein
MIHINQKKKHKMGDNIIENPLAPYYYYKDLILKN